MTASGALLVSTEGGSFEDVSPQAWQVKNGQRVGVDMAFSLDEAIENNARSYVFELGSYDRSKTLIMDPAILIYCGYIGGSGRDAAYGIAVDSRGHAVVTGYAFSTETSFPVARGPDSTQNGSSDVFVAMVSASGSAPLIYCGYIGGSSWGIGTDVAVDLSGTAYVTGYTGSTALTFPVTVGPDLTHNGGYDAFVAKIVVRPAASYTLFGTGCRGSKGVPSLTASGLPRIGNAGFKLLLTSLPANAPALIALGASNTKWANLTLPFDLKPLAPGCKIYASWDIAIAVLADRSGRASLPLPIPTTPSLMGSVLYNDAAILDLRANRLGVTKPNAGKVTIGL